MGLERRPRERVQNPRYPLDLVPWLMLHRGRLRVLVHPLTGDPYAEHTAQALWLGEPLSLDLVRLRQIKTSRGLDS